MNTGFGLGLISGVIIGKLTNFVSGAVITGLILIINNTTISLSENVPVEIFYMIKNITVKYI